MSNEENIKIMEKHYEFLQALAMDYMEEKAAQAGSTKTIEALMRLGKLKQKLIDECEIFFGFDYELLIKEAEQKLAYYWMLEGYTDTGFDSEVQQYEADWC